MGKRKTLRQKQVTDIRRQNSSHKEVFSDSKTHSQPDFSYSFQTFTPKHESVAIHHTAISDVRKTAVISLIIVASQIILYSLLTNHVLALPIVRY
ncbi:MAG TPA: hypothetical protein VF189_00015 [Patescibacteria group bacterium]